MPSFKKTHIDMLRNRVHATTAELHAEVGGVVRCPNDLTYAYRRKKGNRILAVAHCDTVHCNAHHFHYSDDLAYSTKLDDRMGVWIILDLLPILGIGADILLTDGEETCQSTARYFTTEKKYNWIVQFDRRGEDAVTYDYKVMEKPLKEFFQVGWGSYTDIRELEGLGVGAFNVACGYHNEHSLGSYARLWETLAQLNRFNDFWEKHKDTRFIHKKPNWKRWSRHKGPDDYPNEEANGVGEYTGALKPDFGKTLTTNKGPLTFKLNGELQTWQYDEAKGFYVKRHSPLVKTQKMLPAQKLDEGAARVVAAAHATSDMKWEGDELVADDDTVIDYAKKLEEGFEMMSQGEDGERTDPETGGLVRDWPAEI
jgi:hypothetical protein